MLDIQLLRNNIEALAERLATRGFTLDQIGFPALEMSARACRRVPRSCRRVATASRSRSVCSKAVAKMLRQ
jgi:hypothetical protein